MTPASSPLPPPPALSPMRPCCQLSSAHAASTRHTAPHPAGLQRRREGRRWGPAIAPSRKQKCRNKYDERPTGISGEAYPRPHIFSAMALRFESPAASWSVDVQGSRAIVTLGMLPPTQPKGKGRPKKIPAGIVSPRDFPTPEEAQEFAQDMIKTKLEQGYVQVRRGRRLRGVAARLCVPPRKQCVVCVPIPP